MRNGNHWIGVLGLALLFHGIAWADDAKHQVTVSAGESERIDTPVSFAVPREIPAGALQLSAADNSLLPLQVSPDGIAHFILPHLAAHQDATFRITSAAPAPPAVEVSTDGTTLLVSAGGKEILRYQAEKSDLPAGFDPAYARGGYIKEVLTPSGKLVTDDYPPNHKHHHGIWSPWTKTVFEGRHPDFWNMGDKTGSVEFVDHADPWSGPVCAGFTTHHRFMDLSAKPDPKIALNETWDLIVYRPMGTDKPYYLFDLTITQTCATATPLLLPTYRYGGLGFRGNRAWDGKANTTFLTSEGKTRSNGNESRGRWCHISGLVDGVVAGIAILDAPTDFRFPQPMRIHPTEPFFCFAPSQLGDWQIDPGTPYVAKYRFIVADGPADAGFLNRAWEDYGSPPGVKVE